MQLNPTTDHLLFSVDNRRIGYFILIWLGVIAIINPIGDFPLNDDWSYAKPVQSLLNGEGIQFTGWMSMTLFTQVVWGALWCKIFGFSFTVLRCSTLFLSLLGVIYTFRLLKEFEIKETTAWWLSLLVMFNPIYVNLSFTFMTDVPFFAIVMMSIFYFTRSCKYHKKSDWVLAMLFMLIGVLTRQLALVVPFAFLLVGIYRKIVERETRLWYYALPFLVALVSFLIYQQIAFTYFGARGRYDEMNQRLLAQVTETPKQWITGMFSKSVVGFVYAGLFIFPFIVVMMRKMKPMLLVMVAVLSIGLFAYLQFKGYTIPIFDNILYNFGIGPATLYDYWFADKMESHQIPVMWWKIVTCVACIGFSYIWVFILSKRTRWATFLRTPKLFILLIIVGYFIPITSIYCYDRYLLLSIPLVLVVLFFLIEEVDLTKRVYVPLLALICIFSITGTRDYLQWQSAKWKCIHTALAQGVSADKIDGGFEFNGWYNYNDVDFDANIGNLWVHDVTHIIAFEGLKGTEVIHEEPYFSILNWSNKTIKVLRKTPEFRALPDEYFLNKRLLNTQ